MRNRDPAKLEPVELTVRYPQPPAMAPAAVGYATGVIGAGASWREVHGVIALPEILQHFLEVGDREHKEIGLKAKPK